MTVSKMIIAVTILMVGVVCIGGCGGGGSDSGGWDAYTPPASVAPAETREKWAASNVGTTSAIMMVAGEEDPVNLGYMLFGLSEPIVVAIGNYTGSGGTGSMAPQSGSVRSKGSAASFVLGLINRAQQKKSVRSGVQTAETTNLDWIDEEYGIHWTGTLAETETSFRLNIHGVGTDTDVTVAVSLSETKATLTARGHLAQEVEWYDWDTQDWDYDPNGKGDINTSMNFSISDTSGSGTVTSNFTEYTKEGGTWVEVFKGRSTCQLNVRETDDNATMTFTFNPTWGLKAGDGIYWQAYRSTGEVNFDCEEGEWEREYHVTSLILNETSELSDGMTTRLQIARNGDISGWLKDADGDIIANFSGNYLESTGVIDWVDSDRPDGELHIFIMY